ncbi:MAG: hypothetical protein JWQ89_567 [Devosia sp.]|nr:hypothetical protein [Devosia sp.]
MKITDRFVVNYLLGCLIAGGVVSLGVLIGFSL